MGMTILIPLFIGIPAVTLIVDAIWAYEQRDWRRAVEKTAQACDGQTLSPSGFFRRPCRRRAVVAVRDKHYCLGTDCIRQS